jgi:hypothetical protein
MNTNHLILDSAAHTYTIDGRIVPGVTEIIRETTGQSWRVGDWYLERGKAIHACAAFIAQGKKFKFDERLSGYVEALRKYFKEVEPKNCITEILVWSVIYRYAGTLDMNCIIGGKVCLIDWKHSCDKNRIGIQLGGYSQAYKESYEVEINSGYGVEIHNNGTYCMSEKIDLRVSRNQFLALRTAYAIREKCGELSFQKKIDI